MNCENLKFMSIGSNCGCIGYLGKYRIRGPVDNVLGNENVLCFESLFDGTILNEINSPPILIKNRKKYFLKDSDKSYLFKHFTVLHNDPTTEKYKQEFLKRYNNFKEFYSHIQETSHYFTYSLGINEIDRNKHLVKKDNLIRVIEYLKKLNILNKTIFIGTRPKFNKNWNYWATDLQPIADDYNLNYVEVLNFTYHSEEVVKQFLEKVSNLILS